MVVGEDGSVYVSGFTQSADYPTTPTAFDDTYGGGGTFTGDAFVFRLDAAGDTLLYSTYLGGTDGEIAYGLAVDGEGNVYLAGSVESVDFPTTAGAFDTIQNGDVDAYASKLSLPGTTPPGLGKKVSPTDSTTGKNPVELTFSDITMGGITSVTTSPAGAPPPTGFRLGTPPTYYEITTTATFSGIIEICIDYIDVVYGNECTMKVAHFEDTDSDGIRDTWVDLPTSSQDKINDIICAVASSLSPFALFEAEDTDGDGVPDLLDPDPLVAGETLATLEGAAILLADQVRAVDLSLFDAPNANAAAGRRDSLARRMENAGKAAAAGDLEDALELLEEVLARIDGTEFPVDWTEPSPETSSLASQIRLLIGTITGL
ncbi:MAG: SBBP repeat-containing protein [Planctomycetota bacterium]|nr:SBBP repeat-containing protein [Planctomycetota bacterium]